MSLLLSLFLGIAYAFVPPVSVLTKEVVEGRRTQPYSEVVFRHRVEVRPGEGSDLEEQWITGPQGVLIFFRVPGGNPITSASLEKRTYVFANGYKIASSTGLFTKYFLTASSDDLLGGLINERFVRRDHLTQFKPGFEPKGDPQTWDVKEFYIPQEGVSLKRVKSQPAFAFSGSGSDDSSHVVYFSKSGGGIARLEWRVGSDTVGWNFESQTRFQSSGNFPKQMEFEKNGQTLVTTDLLVHRPAKEKQYSELRKSLRATPAPSGQYEEALRILLSFR